MAAKGDGSGCVEEYYGCPDVRGRAYDNHFGIDYDVLNPGQPGYREVTVLSAIRGRVTRTKNDCETCRGNGNFIELLHANLAVNNVPRKVVTLYLHCKYQSVVVEEGDFVERGAPLD